MVLGELLETLTYVLNIDRAEPFGVPAQLDRGLDVEVLAQEVGAVTWLICQNRDLQDSAVVRLLENV